jgi:hypothetical protein
MTTRDHWADALAAMRADGYPMTREGFLDYAYLGDPPPSDQIEEDAIPPQFRHGYAEDDCEAVATGTDLKRT